MKKTYLSLTVKILTVISAIIGLALNFASAKADGYSSAASRLLYFTNLSNILVAAVALVFIVIEIKKLRTGADLSTQRLYLIKLASTVSITLTCFIFCAILAPGSENANYNAWTVGSIFVHTIVPGFAILDFILDSGDEAFKKTHNLISLIPPFVYFGVCVILYVCKVDFGRGDNFPYFFLNFGSPAGIFGTSTVMPYRIGSFYWVIFISLIVYLISLTYSLIHNSNIKRKEK